MVSCHQSAVTTACGIAPPAEFNPPAKLHTHWDAGWGVMWNYTGVMWTNTGVMWNYTGVMWNHTGVTWNRVAAAVLATPGHQALADRWALAGPGTRQPPTLAAYSNAVANQPPVSLVPPAVSLGLPAVSLGLPAVMVPGEPPESWCYLPESPTYNTPAVQTQGHGEATRRLHVQSMAADCSCHCLHVWPQVMCGHNYTSTPRVCSPDPQATRLAARD